MTIADALRLLHDGLENAQSKFSICHSWYFTVEGVGYRLSEMKGHYLRLEKFDLPRVTLEEIIF